MTLSERIQSIVFAFDSRDSRRDEIRELASGVERLERAVEAARAMAECVGEYDDDGAFVPMPRQSLSGEDREKLAAGAELEDAWNAFYKWAD